MSDETTTQPTAHVVGRVEEWRRHLIDLTHRNRLIAYKPTRATTLTIAAPAVYELLADPESPKPWDFYFPPEPEDEVVEESSEAATTVDELLVRSQDRRRPRRPREIEVTETHPKRIARILDNLAKRSNTEFQDKALRILYVAAGFLDWHDAQRDKPISSPLVLVPVELRRESTRHPYRLFFVDDEEIVINPSLTEKLRRDAGLDIPGDWVWEDKPIAQELDEIRQAIAGTGWRVRDEAVIGLFSFQKYVMYRDLLDNEERVVGHPLVRSLAHGRRLAQLRDADPDVPEPQQLDEVQHPNATLSILDADASQRQCIEAAKLGRSFVMQGPPGTGKSQTIANVIAEAIGQGKRILFVSEKAAALDVVHKRLAASELDEYCLMLHGEHAGRREVVQSLDHGLNTALSPRPAMRNDELERLANLRTLLNDSAELLHLPQPLLGGRTLREVHEQLAQLHGAPSVPGAPEASDVRGEPVLDDYQSLSEVFQRIAERWHVSPRDYRWRGYNAERFTADEHGRVLAVLRELDEATKDLGTHANPVAQQLGRPAPASLREVRLLTDLGEHLKSAPSLDASWLDLEPRLLQDTIQVAKNTYDDLALAGNEFADVFPARNVEDFAPELGQRVRAARDEVKRRCGWADAWEGGVAELPEMIKALAELPPAIATLRERAAATAHLVGQPARTLTKGRLDGLAELAELAFTSEHRPEREWLVRAGLERAQQVLDEIKDDVATFQRQRAELLEHYRPEALGLEAADIAERFTTQYTSVFSKLSSDYRRDTKAIKAVRQDGKLPGTLADDLKLIAAAREVGRLIDAKAERISRALGSYGAGRDTDLEATRSAVGVALRANALSVADADLGWLSDKIAIGSSPDPVIAQAADRLREATRLLVDLIALVQHFVSSPPHLFAGDLNEVEAVIAQVSPALHDLADHITDLNTGASESVDGVERVEQRATLISNVHSGREHARVSSDAWAALIGASFADSDTDWDALLKAADWLARSHELDPGALTDAVRARLEASDGRWPDFTATVGARDRMQVAIEQLSSLFEPDRAQELEHQLGFSALVDVAQLCAHLTETVDELRDWTDWRTTWRKRARDQGWDGFVEGLIDAHVGDAEVLAAFQRSYWNQRLEALYDEDPELAEDLRGGAFQRWVDEFRQLDRKLVRTGADRLIARREGARKSHVSTPGSEVDLLRREARKKRRHLPVRVLLARIPTLLSELKPCLMMSPLTVSHFLSPDHNFDLVVFDEASQVPPQDAVNCIYRGKQLIVAGDSKQLPPTPFFQIAELDELAPDDEDARTQEDMESILDACEALLPSHALRWHYRSRSETLIAFSNRHIYNESLVTFPSAEEHSQRMGVSFVHVPEGVYDRGRTASNRLEAQVVARRVMHYLTDGLRRSVGVIAFNTAQANAIGEELDLLKIQHPELESQFRGDRLDAVFVKHLEAVQGDERDVMVFSVGYGPDAAGKFTMNFGPLNKDGGQRRLNVAVTRAREKVELVASVRSRDFKLSEGTSAGASLLRDYVAYAESNGRMGAHDEPREDRLDWTSPFEEQVGEAIAELGYQAAPNVGVGSFRINIGVRSAENPHRFLLGIECDGEGYAQTPTARDRERLRHEVLAALGWGPIHRIWSLDWVRNRSGEIARLRDALDAAGARDLASPLSSGADRSGPDEGGPVSEAVSATDETTPRDRTERVVHELTSSADASDLPWTEVYERAALRLRTSFYEFHETVNRREQTDVLVELMEVEAPVSVDYAIRRLAETWGLQRAGHRVVSAARQSISQAGRRNAVEVRGEFLWRPGQTLTHVRVPDPADPETRRDIDEIPPEELDLAIARLREASAGLDDEQLIGQVARVFGFDRTGGRIRATLAQRLSTAAPGGRRKR